MAAAMEAFSSSVRSSSSSSWSESGSALGLPSSFGLPSSPSSSPSSMTASGALCRSSNIAPWSPKARLYASSSVLSSSPSNVSAAVGGLVLERNSSAASRSASASASLA